MAHNLAAIRTKISKLQAERQRAAAAVPPTDVSEAKLREHLTALAQPSAEFIQNCAEALNTGSLLNLTPATPSMLAQAAFSLALTATDINRVIEAAKVKAAEQDTGALRLADSEKAERLHALSCEIYQLQLDEEAALDGAPRRHDVAAGAVLGIPLESAVEFGLV